MRPGHRARASRGRLSPLTIITLAALAIALSAVAGGFPYLLAAAATAFPGTRVAANVPSPSPPGVLFSPSTAPNPVPAGGCPLFLLCPCPVSQLYPPHF